MKDINTLVFEGGSVKGLAYVGALQVLDLYSQQQENGKPFLEQIQRVAGTSAGSIMALLIALNLNLDQIKIIMQNTSFSSFADKGWYAYGSAGKGTAIYRNGYVCEGLAFLKWAESLLATHTGNKAMTFRELQQMTGKDLHVYAVRLNDSQIVTFNAEETPDVSVALAVRMSMSIPVFFKPVRVSETIGSDGKIIEMKLDEKNGTTYYVDGGVKINYPYQLVKRAIDGLEDKHMLGFKVDSNIEILSNAMSQEKGQYLTPHYRSRTQITEGFGAHLIPYMLTALMSSQEQAHNSNPEESKRTIRSWDCDLSTFDFDLDQKKIDELLASGAQAAQRFIQLQDFNLERQMQALKTIPEEEQDFANNYGQKEAERLSGITKNIQASIQSTDNTALNIEERQHFEVLKADIERLKSNYRIIQQAKIQGNITKGVEFTAANVNALPQDLEYFDRAIKHIQAAIDKGIYQSITVGPGSTLPSLIISAGNLNFGEGPASFLDQRGMMFSPTAFSMRKFIQDAKDFLSGFNNLDKEDEYLNELVSELTALISDYKKDNTEIKNKEQRGQIRAIIKEIEERKNIVDSQKKTLTNA